MAHGAFYLLGAYVGYDIAFYTGSWTLGLVAAAAVVAAVGVAMHRCCYARLVTTNAAGLVTIGFAIVVGDLLLATMVASLRVHATELLYGTRHSGGQGLSDDSVVVIVSALLVRVWAVAAHPRTKLGMLMCGVDDRDISRQWASTCSAYCCWSSRWGQVGGFAG